ncbi:hypothetical protein [Chamaesiphon sp. VAR_48_metabat_135_sub]|nr:hypothetical protein [Chamaesiphon sp. VAR_48_metabat_135_sub]
MKVRLTYKTAVNNGVKALESLMLAYEASGESLPEPKLLLCN